MIMWPALFRARTGTHFLTPSLGPSVHFERGRWGGVQREKRTRNLPFPVKKTLAIHNPKHTECILYTRIIPDL